MSEKSNEKAYIPSKEKLPIGTIMAYAGNVSREWEKKSGWLICNGRLLDRLQYKNLFDAIGTIWGGDATDTFNIPDLRGLFLRGVCGITPGEPDPVPLTSYNDPDANSRTFVNPGGHTGNQVGSFQQHSFGSHSHDVHIDTRLPGDAFVSVPKTDKTTPCEVDASPDFPNRTNNAAFSDVGVMGWGRSQPSTTASIDKSGGSETRPINASVFWIICYR